MLEQEKANSKRTGLPKGFSVESYADHIRITQLWRSNGAYSIAIAALVFNAVWIGNGFVAVVLSDRELLLRAFALLFILLGVGLTYSTIAIWFNRTLITVNDSEIDVKIGPIPWLGSKRVPTINIEQLYVKRRFRGSRDNNPRYTYNVLAEVPGARPLKILSGLNTRSQAQFIEQEIEGYLGIENVRRPDEN